MKEKTTKKNLNRSFNNLFVLLVVVFVLGAALAFCNTAYGVANSGDSSNSSSSDKQQVATKTKWAKLLQKYESKKKVNQLVFVKYKGKSKASLSLYKKKGSKFKKVFTCAACVGKRGINKKKEGDKKTPTGTYSFTKAFGIKKNPGSKIKYIKLNKYYYWSESKKHYNRMVDIRKVNPNFSGEHLIDYKPDYNYSLAIGYNKKCKYKKGSAIFLHCKGKNSYTSGCIAIKEKYMKKILRAVDKSAKICIYRK